MKLNYLYFFCLLLAVSSCEWGVPSNIKPAIYKDTLTYSYKTMQQKAADCTSKTDNGCNIVKFTYPIFKGQQSLNDSISGRLATMFSLMPKADTGFERAVIHFFATYQGRSSNDLQQPPFIPLSEYAKVVRQDSALTTIETGGYLIRSNEPLSNISFTNWNPKANKILTLDDLFKPGYEDSLRSVAEAIFRKGEKLSDTASFAKDYLFKDSKFALNKNYLIAPTGLRFLYNEGEIKPRNAGFTILFIPYGKIKQLLKPHTVVTQFVR